MPVFHPYIGIDTYDVNSLWDSRSRATPGKSPIEPRNNLRLYSVWSEGWYGFMGSQSAATASLISDALRQSHAVPQSDALRSARRARSGDRARTRTMVGRNTPLVHRANKSTGRSIDRGRSTGDTRAAEPTRKQLEVEVAA